MTDPTVPAEHPWRRYVAIGDSFTEGMVDTDPRHEGRFIGWADRLAAELAGRTGGEELHYANLAIRGRKLDDRLLVRTLPAFASRWLAPRLPRLSARHPELVVNFAARSIRFFILPRQACSAAIPAARSSANSPLAASSAASPIGTSATSTRAAAGSPHSIISRSIPPAQPTAGVCGPPMLSISPS